MTERREKKKKKRALAAGGEEEPKRKRAGRDEEAHEEEQPKKKKKKTKVDKASSKEEVKSDGAGEEEEPKKKRKRSEVKEEADVVVKEEVIIKKDVPDGCALIETFNGLSESLKSALKASGKTLLFPIQVKVWSAIAVDEANVLAKAKTGTGKTLAFALPIVQRLSSSGKEKAPKGPPRALVLAPTRELAQQVENEFRLLKLVSAVCCYGGAPYGPQVAALRGGVDVVVGTPGRVKDLVEKGILDLNSLDFLVLDEADQMLDMGFRDDLDVLLEGLSIKQLLLFSATLPNWVEDIAQRYARLTGKSTRRIEIHGQQEDISHVCVFCPDGQLKSVLDEVLETYAGKCLLFCETKMECNDFECPRLHGDVAQKDRDKTIQAFKSGSSRMIVATDVAARGLDLTVDLVVQNKPPTTRSGRADVETYTHRSGRTGRAGRKGTCVTLYSLRQQKALEEIEKHFGSFEWRTLRPTEILESKISKKLQLLDQLKANADLTKAFQSAADRALANDPNVLPKAIALLCGYSEAPKPRSLFGRDDHVTCLLNAGPGPSLFFAHPFAAKDALRTMLPANSIQLIKSLRLSADSKQAVFDLPADLLQAILNTTTDNNKLLIDIAKLPKLKDVFGARAPFAFGARGSSRGAGRRGMRASSYNARGRGGRGARAPYTRGRFSSSSSSRGFF